jgi:hypothetical protein
MRNQFFIILFISSLFIQSCISVPPLILTRDAEAEFIGRSYNSLVESYGLPTNKEYSNDDSYIASWEMGVSNNTVTSFYGGFGFSSGNSEQRRLVTYMSKDNLVYRVQSIGYQLGNENEVNAANRANTYLGLTYVSGLLSLIYLWTLDY